MAQSCLSEMNFGTTQSPASMWTSCRENPSFPLSRQVRWPLRVTQFSEAGLHAVSELIFRGIPINITLLFSPDQYVAAAEAYLVGVERRIEAGLSPSIYSVASVFVSRWDVAVRDRVPEHLRNRLGIAVAETVYGTYRELMASHRWQRALNYGAYFQRLLWASTGTKDPQVSKALYVAWL